MPIGDPRAAAGRRIKARRGSGFVSRVAKKARLSLDKLGKTKPLKLAGASNTYYTELQGGSVAISVYVKKSQVAIAQGSGISLFNDTWNSYITQDPVFFPPGSTSPIIVTAAHLALPTFATDVAPVCMPFVTPLPSDTGNTGPHYGVTTLNQWPYKYLADVYNDDMGQRVFVELEILGVDWKHDVAVFWIPNYNNQPYYNFHTLNMAGSDVNPGDFVYSVSNLWGQVPTVFSAGVVRQNNFQYQAQFPAITSTQLCMGSSTSGAPVTNIFGNVVGMHLGRVAGSAPYSIECTWANLSFVTETLVDAAINTDAITFGDTFCVALAVSMPDLACDASLYSVEQISLAQAIPIDQGYVFHVSEPYGGLQNVADFKDLLITIDGLALGPYSYQYNISDAIQGKTDVTVGYLEYGIEGYGPACEVPENVVYQTIALHDDVGNFWQWFFRWALPAGGFPSMVTM